MNEYESLLFSLAWVAFREQTLLDQLERARADGGELAAIALLVEASRYAMGEVDTGPSRRDLRPYIHRVGGPGDAAHRLGRELANGHVRFHFTNGAIILATDRQMWERSFVSWGEKDLALVNPPRLCPRGPSTQPQPDIFDQRHLDLFLYQCHVGDVRERFGPHFTLHNFQGVWRPVRHNDPEPTDGALSYPAMMESTEARAIRVLVEHLSGLDDEGRKAFRRSDAAALLATGFGLTARGFDRTWSQARQRVGLPSRAAAGRKRVATSRRSKPKSPRSSPKSPR